MQVCQNADWIECSTGLDGLGKVGLGKVSTFNDFLFKGDFLITSLCRDRLIACCRGYTTL